MVSSTLFKAVWAAALGIASVHAVCTFTWEAGAGDTCSSLADVWGITVAQFQQYNPTVKCPTLTPGVAYCVEWDYGAAPTTTTTTTTPTTITSKPTSPTTTTTTTSSPSTSKTPTTSTTTTTVPAVPSPTQDGLISTCKSFYLVSSGDTCGAIVSKYNTFSLADFYKWNPAVGSDCTSLWVGYYVCVGVPGTPTTTSKGTTTAPPAGPTPTQSGITSKCANYYLVKSGDTCANIVARYGAFSLSDFYGWNPAVGSDCASLWTGYYVCVGVPGTPTKPTSTSAPPSGPTPTQAGIVSSCNAWYQAKTGDYCQKIVDQYKTFSLQDFYKWNPAVGTTCSSLWVGYYYCVGVKK